MNKESKINLNASDYAISHCDSDKTYNGLEVHKMLCDAYIAGNLDDKDEKIRKALINVFATHKDYEMFFGVSVEDICAWLEKQGEKKSTDNPTQQEAMDIAVAKCFNEQEAVDKVVPKFKVGNTIKYVGERKELAADKYTIKEMCNDCYITTCGSKIPFRMQEYYVIVNDAKGLKKIETSLPSFDEQQGTPVIVHNKEHCQNTAWSEEDEDNLTDTCVAIRKFYHRNNGAQDLIDWLKSLKERVIWKPSDKQIIALRWVLNNIPYNTHKEEISGLLEQIQNI